MSHSRKYPGESEHTTLKAWLEKYKPKHIYVKSSLKGAGVLVTVVAVGAAFGVGGALTGGIVLGVAIVGGIAYAIVEYSNLREDELVSAATASERQSLLSTANDLKDEVADLKQDVIVLNEEKNLQLEINRELASSQLRITQLLLKSNPQMDAELKSELKNECDVIQRLVDKHKLPKKQNSDSSFYHLEKADDNVLLLPRKGAVPWNIYAPDTSPRPASEKSATLQVRVISPRPAPKKRSIDQSVLRMHSILTGTDSDHDNDEAQKASPKSLTVESAPLNSANDRGASTPHSTDSSIDFSDPNVQMLTPRSLSGPG